MTRRAAAVTAAVAAMAAWACTDVPTGADVPFALEFERLPFPAVVAGDVLRDSTGAAAPLTAVAYNVDGAPIVGASIQYLLVGSAATLEGGTIVRGVTAGDTVSVTAVAGSVPSLPQTLYVVPRPDSLVARATTPDTLRYTIPPNPTADAVTVGTTLLARVNASGTPVRGWVMRFRLVARGDTLAPSDTSLAWLVDDLGRRSAIDTTDASGVATRRVRVNSLADGIDALDSVVVSVTPVGITTRVAGAPARIVVPVRRR